MKTYTVSIYCTFIALSLVFAHTICYAGEDAQLSSWSSAPSPDSFPALHGDGKLDGEHEAERDTRVIDEQGRVSYIIRVDEPGLFEEQLERGVRSEGQGYVKGDPGTRLYKDHLKAQLELYLGFISSQIGREVVKEQIFLFRYPGFVVWLYEDEAALVEGLPGILKVIPNRRFFLQSYRGPSFIGADLIWEGASVPAGVSGTRREGMVIGVLDTGINPDHPAFRVHDRGYCVASSGNVTDDVWKECIKNQTPLEPDNDFEVV